MSTQHTNEKNLYGQEIRRKGRETRQRIMDATAQLMATVPIRDLRIVDIGRIANVSKATFYIYFESVEEAALAVIDGLNQSTPQIMQILASEWELEQIEKKVRELVNAYFSYWRDNQALLRVRNFAADEGDKRFFLSRKKAIGPLHVKFQEKIVILQEQGICPAGLHPPSTVSVILAMLERVAAIIGQPSAHGATSRGERDGAVAMITSALAPAVAFEQMTPKQDKQN